MHTHAQTHAQATDFLSLKTQHGCAGLLWNYVTVNWDLCCEVFKRLQRSPCKCPTLLSSFMFLHGALCVNHLVVTTCCFQRETNKILVQVFLLLRLLFLFWSFFFVGEGNVFFSKSSLQELSDICNPLYFSADCLSFTDKFKSSREKKMEGTRGINHTEQANQNRWELHRLEWSYISRKVHVSLCHRLHSRGSEVCSYDAPVA